MRSCEVTIEGTTINATFHAWSEYADTIGESLMVGGHPGGQIKYPVAIIEYESGQCGTVPVHAVRFTDKATISITKKLKIKQIEDKALAKELLAAVKKNRGYCPCKMSKNQDTKCICKEFREQPWPGTCECGLYIKVEE